MIFIMTNIEENKYDFEPSPSYIQKYNKKYDLFYIKNDLNCALYVLDKSSSRYENFLKMKETGVCASPLYAGDWYKLDLNEDPYYFGLFIIQNGFTKEGKWNTQEKTIDAFKRLNCFTKNHYCTTKQEINEQNEHYKSWDEVPKEILKDLTEWSKQHSYKM